MDKTIILVLSVMACVYTATAEAGEFDLLADGLTCADTPCQNGATCHPFGINGYRCVCTSEYSGRRCSLFSPCNPSVSNYCAPGTSECSDNGSGGMTPCCKNGGTCQTNCGLVDCGPITCICEGNWTGNYCCECPAPYCGVNCDETDCPDASQT